MMEDYLWYQISSLREFMMSDYLKIFVIPDYLRLFVTPDYLRLIVISDFIPTGVYDVRLFKIICDTRPFMMEDYL